MIESRIRRGKVVIPGHAAESASTSLLHLLLKILSAGGALPAGRMFSLYFACPSFLSSLRSSTSDLAIVPFWPTFATFVGVETEAEQHRLYESMRKGAD